VVGSSGRLEPDGAAAWATVERRGLEGFVAKDPESTYRQGPTRSWIKVKLRREGVFVVGGISDVDAFDGALVGERVSGELMYRGVVEWGFRAEPALYQFKASHVVEFAIETMNIVDSGDTLDDSQFDHDRPFYGDEAPWTGHLLRTLTGVVQDTNLQAGHL